MNLGGRRSSACNSPVSVGMRATKNGMSTAEVKRCAKCYGGKYKDVSDFTCR